MNITDSLNPFNNLGEFIEHSLTTYADKPAFSCLNQTMSFKEIDRKSFAFACYLQHHLGLIPGDRIVIQLPNLIQYPIAVYGALRAGLVIVNTNPLYTTREMRHQFQDSGAKVIVILKSLLPKFDEIASTTQIEHIIVTDIMDMLSGDIANDHDYIPFNQALSYQTSRALMPLRSKLDDVCVLQYTGGTTGVSKGASLTHHNLISNVVQTLELLGDSCGEAREIFVCPLPLYHIYAFMANILLFFSRGNLNILIPDPRNLDAFVEQIRPFKFTGIAGINTLFVGLSRHEGFQRLDFSQLRLSLSGGTALTTAAEKQWFELTGCHIFEGYGLSETSPALTFNKPGEQQLGTVGRPLIGTVIEFWDRDDKPVADGCTGQLVAKGPQVMKGYWNRPDETASAMTQDGFFKTGDIGLRQPDGFIKIVDRLKDMVIVSGFNVFPNEVEEVLVRHPDIIEAAVIGEPDDTTGEKVCAYLTVSSPVTTQSVIDFCREQLTAYKIPKKLVVMDELPKSSVGKILRRELR